MKNGRTVLSVKWREPGVTAAAAASVVELITAEKAQSIVLPVNQAVEIEVPSGGPAFLKGQLPSGRFVDESIQLEHEGATAELVVSDHASCENDSPALAFHKALGTHRSADDTPQPRSSEGKRIRRTVSREGWSEGLWLRHWCFRQDLASSPGSPWRAETPQDTFLERHDDALIIHISDLPTDRPNFLELGKLGRLSRFVAIPPVESIAAVIRASSNPQIYRVNGGITMKLVATDPRYAVVESALQYMKNSGFKQVGTLVDRLDLSNWQTQIDPYLGLVAGYYFLRVGAWRDQQGFVERFAEEHHWMPDSYLVRAQFLMARANQEKEIKLRGERRDPFFPAQLYPLRCAALFRRPAVPLR